MSKNILDAFEGKTDDDFEIWKPEKVKDLVLGTILSLGKSNDYDTPYMVVEESETGKQISVYAKKGIVPKFRAKNWLDDDEIWVNKEAIIGQNIGIQYLGMKKGKGSNEFQHYKIIYHEELEQLGIKILKKKS